ncbi:iron(III) transport system substrate-binding protein [Paenibacillus macquariensis]|uniref:Iron(III) transport system substrate-binding protein n=2 Tax=Paenibacillus macquariensis TaxID=948756 RepID=A0ABY1K4V8_9BACL|nr:iron(III) transport system substrate-binding protein [Paenibacillus macquariensis]
MKGAIKRTYERENEMKKWVSLLLVSMMAMSITAGCGNNSKDALNGKATNSGEKQSVETKNNKEITVYTALEDDQIQAYLTSYNTQHPETKVNIVRDSTGIITAKLLAEKDNPVADAVWGLAATSLLALDKEGLLEPYAPVGLDRIQDKFRDNAETPKWVGIDAWETALIVNTVELEKKNLPIPTSYEDLTKPEYKGMIVMPNPASSGTGFLDVAGWLQLMGEDKGWAFMDKLHENVQAYTHSGSKPAKMAASGEAVIGISFGYRGITEKKKGAPVEVVFPSEGSGWDVEANGLIKKPEMKAEAKQFLDWAISDEPMKEYNKNYAIIAVKGEGTVIPEGYSKNPIEQLIKYDLVKSADSRDAVLAEWSKRYDGKSEPKS